MSFLLIIYFVNYNFVMEKYDKKLTNLASDLFDLSVVLDFYCQNNNEEGVAYLRPLVKFVKRLADDLYYEIAFKGKKLVCWLG